MLPIALAAPALAQSPAVANLRAYGRVSAALAPHRAVFACENPAKADVLFGKMLADMFWDAGAAHTTQTAVIGRLHVIVHSYPPFGSMIAARCGSRVVVLGGANAASVLKMARREPEFKSGQAAFAPKSPYPIYLDMYDLRSVQLYTNEMSSPYGYGLPSHWDFIKKFGLGGTAFITGFSMTSPAPGVVDWSPSDYEIETARRMGGMVVPGFAAGGQLPFWMWNSDPDEMMQPSPTTLLGAWTGLQAGSAPFESWGMSSDNQASGPLGYLRAAMDRYKDNPAVGGWHIYSGAPGVEMGFHDRTTEFWDYSPAGEQSFRSWLRDKRRFSLRDLSLRWYGVPDRFGSWSQVALPDVNSFFGNLDSSCLVLGGAWDWHDGGGDPTMPPSATAGGWIPVEAQPSQDQATLPWATAFMRKSFVAGDWLKGKDNSKTYLVCDLSIRSDQGATVWLNGKSLGSFRPQNGDYGAFAVDVTGMLTSGANELMLRIPTEGKSIGPVFLTTSQPLSYPYLGSGRNLQYVDFKRWQADSITAVHEATFREARQIDPDRPMILSSGDIGGLADQVADLANRYNLGVQFTGREAWYFPWWAGLGYVDGFYATSEPSNTPQGDNLDKMLSWIMIDGDSSHTLCWTLEDFIKRERDTGWFTRNSRALQLFGKSLRAKPSIALLHSVQTTLLGDNAPMDWDIGRGELQSAHFDNVYVTEKEVEEGKASDYPVLFDCGSELMDHALVDAIGRYVRAGGTFVALQNTGLHTFSEPNSHPIAELTGFNIEGASKSGTITFQPNLPVFKGWEGRQFQGDGFALDTPTAGMPTDADFPVAAGSITPLARWQDGTTAIGYRTFGKGRVIYLGTTVWRSGRDLSGLWQTSSQVESGFFERLFSDLNVERNADAASSDVWARKYITKNGLQDWLIATNTASSPVTTDLELRAGQRPDEVFDTLTKQPVAFSFTGDGWVHIPGVVFGSYGLRVFGVRRATLVAGLSTWWHEKTKYWSIRTASDETSAAPADSDIATRTIPFTRWKFFADATQPSTADLSWTQEQFDDSSWQVISTGPWQIMAKPLADYQGTGLYRASFVLPEKWAQNRVLLGLYSFDTPIVFGVGDFYLNGKLVTTYHARGWNQTLRYDVTDLLRPGANVLAVRAAGGGDLSGLSGAVWLEPEYDFAQTISQDGPWTAVAGDYVTATKVALPGRITAKYLEREVAIPASWSGKDVFLRISTPSQWLSMVMVNGRAISDDIFGHEFGTLADINISPYLHAGMDNRIELWPYSSTVPRYGQDSQKTAQTTMDTTSVAIGYVEQPGK
jgi:hypothetical protein